LSNLHKIGKYSKEIGKVVNKNFHIVSIETAPDSIWYQLKLINIKQITV